MRLWRDTGDGMMDINVAILWKHSEGNVVPGVIVNNVSCC